MSTRRRRTVLEVRLAARRLLRRSIAPARRPDGAPLRVTTPYRKPGPLWALGYHTGEDYAAPIGSLAVAVSWGRVIAVGSTTWGPAYGTMVVVRTASGRYDYAYCHLSRVDVKVGDRVRPGKVLGRTGDTGNTRGAHLHFEARTRGGRYGSDVHPAKVRRGR